MATEDSTQPAVIEPDLVLHRFTVDRYLQAAKCGGLDGAQVELLSGVICNHNKVGSPNEFAVSELERRFHQLLAPGDAVQVHQFGVNRFRQMSAGGVFDDVRVELFQGWVCDMPPISPRHEHSTQAISRLLMNSLAGEYNVRSRLPVDLATSVLQPDICVAIGDTERYQNRPPSGLECRLVCEVADGSLTSDRNFKLWLYAAAGIPEYWIVNLIDSQVERFTQPLLSPEGLGQYGERAVFKKGEALPMGEYASLEIIQAADCLP